MRNFRIGPAALLVAALALGGARVSNAQTPASAPVERLFRDTKAQVDLAVQKLQASASGRLPVLNGFVGSTPEPLERYDRGYYQFTMQVTADPSGGTLVHVTASITAWYSDPNGARSGYRVLPSNGRLESDFLESLSELLTAGNSGSPGAAHPFPKAPKAASSEAAKPAVPRDNPTHPPAVGGAANAPLAEDSLESLRQRREQAEARMKELSHENENLEEILRNVAHPADLVMVRKPATPVYARPEAGAKVLFTAEAQDEFQLLDKQSGWVHIQISGLSRGWIRTSQVDLPEGQSEDSKASTPEAAPSSAYIIERQETGDFTGDWAPLRGKTARILWVGSGPAPVKAATARERLGFSRSLLMKTYQDLSISSAPVAGIVIVFDSADGGQISATMANLKDWVDGKLTESEFWKQCLLDPPDLFQSPGKP